MLAFRSEKTEKNQGIVATCQEGVGINDQSLRSLESEIAALIQIQYFFSFLQYLWIEKIKEKCYNFIGRTDAESYIKRRKLDGKSFGFFCILWA